MAYRRHRHDATYPPPLPARRTPFRAGLEGTLGVLAALAFAAVAIFGGILLLASVAIQAGR